MERAAVRILFDGTVLRNGCGQNASRSGVFMVANELLRALLRKGVSVDVQVALADWPTVNRHLASDPDFAAVGFGELAWKPFFRFFLWIQDHGITPEMRCGLLRQLFFLPYRLIRKIFLKMFAGMVERLWRNHIRLDAYDAFLSPVFKADPSVVANGLPRFTILYDALPLLFPDFFRAAPQPWLRELFDSLEPEDRCFAISQRTKEDCLRFVPNLRPENVTVIPLAAGRRFHVCGDLSRVEAVRRKLGIPEGTKYFLSLCSIEPRKNLPFALRAFATVARTHPDVRFVLAGGMWGAYENEWRTALSALGEFRDRVILPGYVEDDDLAPLYSGATAFVYLSLYEGFGLPPLEAMQCGCPVLCSNTSSLPEVVGDAALMVSPDDLEGTVTAMARLADDGNLREGLRTAGLARAKLFSWERAAEIVLAEMCGEVKK